MNHLTRRGLIAGALVAGVFLFANWPRMIKFGLSIAGFPFTFATRFGSDAADIHAANFAIDLLIAIAAVVATLLIFSRSGKKRDAAHVQSPTETPPYSHTSSCSSSTADE
jgi:hypothetical protein